MNEKLLARSQVREQRTFMLIHYFETEYFDGEKISDRETFRKAIGIMVMFGLTDNMIKDVLGKVIQVVKNEYGD